MNYCLGIESTAHTIGFGIVSFEGKILANERSVFTSLTGGMIPNEVAGHHELEWGSVMKRAFEKAEIGWDEICLISYSAGPGLSPCLRVGLGVAKKLAEEHNKPIVGVNHCVAHLSIGKLLTGLNDPVYLFVSGANTQVICLACGRFRIFGETLDIGLGNALDKFGRAAELGFPAGPKMEQLAKNGGYVELPYSVKGMDVSFSGIVTKCIGLLNKFPVEDLCFSLQETCFAMLAEVAERALAHSDRKELVLIGGVAANQRLCEMLGKMCSARNAVFKAVPIELSGDQGAMIAWQGMLQHSSAGKNIDIRPYERTDDIIVDW